MGTNPHSPPHQKDARRDRSAHPHDDDKGHAAAPGARPGTRSRVLEMRERLRKRGVL